MRSQMPFKDLRIHHAKMAAEGFGKVSYMIVKHLSMVKALG